MARKKNKKGEKELLEEYLKEELDKRNIYNFKGNPRALKGFPDRIVMVGITYYIELKLGKENDSYYEQTSMQKKWEQQVSQSKNIYLLLQSREEIDYWVNKIYEDCKRDGIKNYFAYNKNI